MSEEAKDIMLIEPITALTVFGKEGGSESVIDSIRKQVEALELDVSTEKGRAQIRSAAHKIARTKTALDEQGKSLKSEMQKMVDLVDRERKKIRDACDELKENVRKPLTDFENAEKLRVEGRENRITAMSALLTFTCEATVDLLNERIAEANSLFVFDWQEFVMRAEATHKEVSSRLTEMRDIKIKHDAERAELERLRKEQAEREQKEREERIAREAADAARKEAEEKAARDAKAAQDKADREKREAEEREAAERKAKEDAIRQAEEVEAKRKADAERAEKEKAEAIERAAREERERIEVERRKQEAEVAAREADKKHMAKVNNEVLRAIYAEMMLLLKSNKDAKVVELAMAVVVAIASGKVPHTKINY